MLFRSQILKGITRELLETLNYLNNAIKAIENAQCLQATFNLIRPAAHRRPRARWRGRAIDLAYVSMTRGPHRGLNVFKVKSNRFNPLSH